MVERIRTTIQNGIADVRLIRSDKMNALDQAMFEALVEASRFLASEPNLRCVVLSGEGKAFCAGLDVNNFASMGNANAGRGEDDARRGLSLRTHGITNLPQQAVWGWRELRVPVIAAVHGVAFGGGFQVMLGADIRIVHPETKLSIMEIRWGIVPDMAGPTIMRNLARDDIVRELTYTGRVFSGLESREYGFATQVSRTPYEDAVSLARTIASKSPSAIRGAKKLFNTVGLMSDEGALLQESQIQDSIIGRTNQIEAVMSQMEGREPRFQDEE